MSIDSISAHADACRQRPYLSRWFPANIEFDGERYSFGETELATIEETLRQIDNSESLFIYDPIPSDRIPIGIGLAYVRTQDPRFPIEGFIGQGKSLLAFPALHHGYVSTFDNLREGGIGKSPRLVDRKPIDQLSDAELAANIYTAKNNFEFDSEGLVDIIGAVFVDLRKPEWGSMTRRFDTILGLFESSNRPFIFYSDERTTAAEILADRMETLEVSNELLQTAETTGLPDNPSLTTRFEHLINTSEVTVEQIIIGYPELYQIVSNLSAMRNDLQASDGVQSVIKMEVGWLFNLLTRLPVKPEYWDTVVADNYYQQGIHELIENLRGKAQRLEGRSANVLINYCEAASALQGHLNTHHPLQETLFDLITDNGNHSFDGQRVVVVRNDFERKAILRAITLEELELLDTVSIRTVDEVEPIPEGEIIIARPLDSESYVYDFPTARRIAFLHFEPWAPIVETRLADGMKKIGATVRTREIGQTGGRTEQPDRDQPRTGEPPTTAYESPDTPTGDPTEALREDFESGRSSAGSGGATSHSTQASDPDIEIALSNGESRRMSAQSRVSVLKENGDIARKQADELTVGETLLILDTVTEDVYDVFIESAHQKEKLRKAESVVERWRSILQDGLDGGMMAEELLAELQDHGSDITDVSTVSNWRTGEAIGPRDPEDVRRVLSVLKPEMEPTYESTVDAMKRIRKEHRKIGRRARRTIEAQMGNSIAGDLTAKLPDEIGQASEEVRKATIDEITSLIE